MPIVSAWVKSSPNSPNDRKSFVCKGKPGVAIPVSPSPPIHLNNPLTTTSLPSSPISNMNNRNHQHGSDNGSCKHGNCEKDKKSTTTTLNGSTTPTTTNVLNFTSRCPHVILIGDLYIEDLDVTSLIALQQRKRHESKQSLENDDEDESDQNDENNDEEDDNEDEMHNGADSKNQIARLRDIKNGSSNNNNGSRAVESPVLYLTCDECDQRKNLWLCLREDCLYVGCGQSNLKHSTDHAQVSSYSNQSPLKSWYSSYYPHLFSYSQELSSPALDELGKKVRLV